MDAPGLPGGEGKGQFPGTDQGPSSSRDSVFGVQHPGSNRRFGRLRTKRVPLIVITSLLLFSLTYTFYWTTENATWKFPENTWSSKIMKYLDPEREHPAKNRCPLQKPDPFAPRMMAFINKTIFRSNFSCTDDPALGIFKGAAFHLEKGHLLVRDVEFPKDVKCCFKVVTRDGDESVRIHPNCTELSNEVNQTTAIQLPTEVILVTCNNSKGENYYTDGFQILQEKPGVEEIVKTWQEEKLKPANKVSDDDGILSVVIFGMDSVSQMQFERSMPLTKSYLENDLKAVKLKGYNKVSENTFPNVMAFLTCLTDKEFYRAFLRSHRRLGNCPFIWNTFAYQGYRTAYFDDETSFSLFNMLYPNAFEDYPPTDYYGRPYALLMGRTLNLTGFCHGPRLSFQHLLNNVKTMADMFNSSDRPYFSLTWSTSLSHASLNTLTWGDKPLLEALEYLHGNGHLNHTAFFLLGDHGWRGHDDVYEAMIENRMPLAYIVLPPWFSQRYPKAFQNLQWNGENSVASPFDMYHTLQDMLDLDRFDGDNDTWRANQYFKPTKFKKVEIAKRGQSLFELNSQGRNCESAGIPPLWCLCHEMAIPLEKDSFLAVSAAESVMEELNRKADKIDSIQCERLHLAEIVNATAVLFNKETWSQEDCRHVISSASSKPVNSSACSDNIYISLRIRGAPHDPVYQTMMVRNSTGAFLVPGEIVRQDWYSTKGHCVENSLRPYCICKDFE